MQKSLRGADIVPIGIGYYTAPEAARLLKTTPRNISRWLGGYAYRGANGEIVEAPPLWRPQLPRLGDSLEIGFHDLIELRFVLAFLNQNVGLNVIRRCLENARRIIGEERRSRPIVFAPMERLFSRVCARPRNGALPRPSWTSRPIDGFKLFRADVPRPRPR